MLLLPLPASPAYNVITTIEGVDYELVYTYDEHRDLWRFGVDSLSGDAVMGHRPLLPFVPMRPNAFASVLEGVFALIAPLPTGDAYEALTGGLWSVVYGLPAEIADLTEGLADLASDADAPVVPIDVLYPPNNAILSSPVVTFSGTGPANQLLFARGESIQVDSMGSWVWTHTFSEASPNVVFEGESGQRATVRLSIIMQPLLINPVGEDIDGTRYVFTEDVHVSGSATPNSAIIVNGQPVSVGGDGLWSVELTLQAGQSHVITAQGADGQIAQASVYVWGEQDLMALEPDIWLDPSDVATLFVDAAGAQPVQFSGDPVGLWKNKGALGSVGDASQPVSANRFVWTDAGGGKIEASGMQRLITQVQNLNYPVECWAVVEPLASVRSSYLSNRIPGTATSGVNAAISENSLHIVAVRDGGTPVINSAYSSGTTSAQGSRVVWFRIERERIVVGQNVEAEERTYDFNRQLLAQLGGPPLEIGTRGASEHMRIGSVLIFDRLLTEVERVKLRTFLEAHHGN